MVQHSSHSASATTSIPNRNFASQPCPSDPDHAYQQPTQMCTTPSCREHISRLAIYSAHLRKWCNSRYSMMQRTNNCDEYTERLNNCMKFHSGCMVDVHSPSTGSHDTLCCVNCHATDLPHTPPLPCSKPAAIALPARLSTVQC